MGYFEQLSMESLDYVPRLGSLVPLSEISLWRQTQAVVDEAIEVQRASRSYEDAIGMCDEITVARYREHYREELADVIQAAFDALVRDGADAQVYIDRVHDKNEARGRYA